MQPLDVGDYVVIVRGVHEGKLGCVIALGPRVSVSLAFWKDGIVELLPTSLRRISETQGAALTELARIILEFKGSP